MSVRDPIDRWRLSESATDEDRAEWERARAMKTDRVGRRNRARILQSLWKRGAIITQPHAEPT